MRRVLLLCLICLGCCEVCFAANLSGKQADKVTTITYSQAAFDKVLRLKGLAPGSRPAPAPQHHTGKQIWAANRCRVESYDASGTLQIVGLMNTAEDTLYLVEPAKLLAWKSSVDFKSAAAATLWEGKQDYQSQVALFKHLKGFTVKELGTKLVNGQTCQGLAYTMQVAPYYTMLVSTSGNPETQALIKALLGKQDTLSGELWISKEQQALLHSTVNLSGIVSVSDYSNIRPWSGPASTFEVPAGYRIEDGS
jgi:hypothetical protein